MKTGITMKTGMMAMLMGFALFQGVSGLGISNAIAEEAKSPTEIVMYKSPTCGCCGNWAEHLRGAGFTVVEKKQEDMGAIKAKFGVPEQLSSCHTAIIDGYIIEGHVPAADVQRLLKEKPMDVVGLTAPGMPKQSPGMQDKTMEPKNYDVLAFDKNGASHVFTRY